MKAVVVTGGAHPPREKALEWAHGADLIIAADSGLDTARRYGWSPQLVVGDFDSISDDRLLAEFESSKLLRFPPEKDETDTEIAIRIAREEGCNETVLIGGGGGRLDHLLAIVALFERPMRPDAWISNTAIVIPVERETIQQGQIGEIISFFPLGCEPARMRSQGLRWPLDGITWTRGDTGISNEFSEEQIGIAMITGRLLMVRPVEDS